METKAKRIPTTAAPTISHKSTLLGAMLNRKLSRKSPKTPHQKC